MKRCTITVTLFLTALLAVAAVEQASAQAWAGSGRIKGVVTDTDGEPIKGAIVTYRMMQDRDTGPEAFETNKKGKYSFLGLRGGLWFVRAEAEGFDPWEGAAEVYSSGAPEELEIQLERIPEEELLAIKRYEANEELKAGDALMDEGKSAEARAKYEAALAELDEQDHAVVFAAIANTYTVENNLDQAQAFFEKALAIAPDHLPSLKGVCNIYAGKGMLAEADAVLTKIPADEPLHPNILITMGMGHYNNGAMDQAKVLLDRAVANAPDVALVYYYRGLINLSDDQESAAADLRKSLELDPNHPQAASATEFLGYLEPAKE